MDFTKMEYDEDTSAQIVVAMNSYVETLDESSKAVIKICNDMLENESLNGNQGTEFREAYRQIADGMTNLQNSVHDAAKTFDCMMSAIAAFARSGSAAEAKEAMKKAAAGQGLMGKKDK